MSEKDIISALKEHVRRADLNTATLKSLRKEVVEELQLPLAFFASSDWREKSKTIIDNELEKLQGIGNSENTRSGDQQHTQSGHAGSKTGSNAKLTRKQSSTTRTESTSPKVLVKDPPESPKLPEPLEAGVPSAELYDTDLSDVLDEAPVQHKAKKRKRTVTSSKTQKSSSSLSSSHRSSSGKEEVTKLKSQLLKCGIRKQWARILDPMLSDKARISFLKAQLESIGMKGRFSLARAKEIKEQREFAQDLRDLQQEAETFLGDSRQAEPTTRRKKHRPMVLQSDDDESDS